MLDQIDLVNLNSHRIILGVILFICWIVIFTIINYTVLLKNLPKNKADDTRNRIVSIIHGFISLSLSFNLLFPNPPYDHPNSNMQIFVCQISLAYFLYDLIFCIYYNLSDTGLIIHHAFCFTGFGVGIISGYGCIDGIMGVFVAEVSNLPMHFRAILKDYQLKYTKAYQYSQNSYFLIYIISRGCFLPFILLYPCLSAEKTPIIVKLMCFAIAAQSWYFIHTMYFIIGKKLKKYGQMETKKVSFQWFKEEEQELKKLSFYKKSQKQKVF